MTKYTPQNPVIIFSMMLLPHLVASMNEAKDILKEPNTASEEQRTQLRQACSSLLNVLETPTDKIINGSFQVRILFRVNWVIFED